MDGSGRLFHSQKKIWHNFDVRCLSLSPVYGVSWQKLTQQLTNLIQGELRINGNRQVYLCGESFGACLALKLIETTPNLCNGVILVNSASAFEQRQWLNLGSYITQIMPSLIYQGATHLLLPFLAKLEVINIRERKRLLKVMQSLPPLIVSWRINLLQNFQANFERLNQFSQPVLILASDEDKILPSVEEAQKLKQIFSQSKVSILTQSGHCCLLEDNIDLYNIIQYNL